MKSHLLLPRLLGAMGFSALVLSSGTVWGGSFNVSTGHWNVDSNWNSPASVPATGATAGVGNGRTVIIDATDGVIAGIPANIRIGFLGNDTGTLEMDGGSFASPVGTIVFGFSAGDTGNLIMTGGTLTSSSSIQFGAATGATGNATISGGSLTAGGGSGLLVGSVNKGIISQSGGTVISTSGFFIGNTTVTGSSYTVSGGTIHWAATGLKVNSGSTFKVVGSGSTLSDTDTTTTDTGMSTLAGSTLSFVLSSSGVSAISLNNTRLAISTGALLTIDGSAFTGTGTTNIDLIDNISLITNVGIQFTPTFTSFNGYTESIIYNANSVVLQVTQVPEPSTVALLAAGLGLLALAARKRLLTPA